LHKHLKASLGVAAIALVGTVLFASPANAATTGGPTPMGAGTVLPGGNVDVGAQIWNGYTDKPAYGSPSVTLTAPSHSHFLNGNLWREVVGSGSSSYQTCALSNGNKTMTCPAFAISVPAGKPGAWQFFNFTATVTADADAPYGQTFDDGTITITSNGEIIGGSTKLQYKVAAKPAAPKVTSVDQSSGDAILHGTGQPGATVTVKDSNGKVIGKPVVVGPDGTYSVNVGSAVGDLNVTQTAGGVTSDPTTVSVVATPIVDAKIAGGAGVAAIAALGAVIMVRRKRATA
jgi:hypothetical protein